MSDGSREHPSAAPVHGLARGVFVVAAFAVVANAARVGQDVAIAWRYGIGPQVDAFYFVQNLVNWPVAVALSTLTLLVVPVEAALPTEAHDEAARRFRGELLGLVLLVALLAWPLAWWGLGAVAGSPVGGLGEAAAGWAVAGLPAMSMVVPLGVVGALLAAWLVSTGRHVLTLLEALPALVVVLALTGLSSASLFWSTAAGVALQVLVMAVLLAATRVLPAPRLGFTSAAWHGFAQGALVLVVAQLLFAMMPLVDAFFAARLGEGALAALNFAGRLTLGLQGLAGLALQRVGLPLLSRLVVVAPDEARRAAVRWAAAAGVLGLVVGLATAALADPLVSILFEHGRFTAANREQVATLLRWSMLQLPPFLAGIGLATALASASQRGTLALIGGAGLAVKIALSAVLVVEHGVVGLLWAAALMYTTTALLAWLALNRCLRQPTS